MSAMAWLALLLPWAAGALACRVLLAERGPGAWALSLGAGYLVGVAGLGVALRLAAPSMPVADLFAHGATWLAVLVVALGVAMWWLGRRARATPVAAADGGSAHRAAWSAVVLLLAIVGILALLQATALPTLAWDAWNAWLAKSKAWYHVGSMRTPLSAPAWLAATPGSGIAVLAEHYPDTLPRVALWMASAAGSWDEAAVHLPWPMLWLALALLLFGLQRRVGVGAAQALAVTAFVATLPLVVAHAVLAGYGDLWIAAMLLLAVAQTERWLALRRWQDGALALLAVALLPALKQEGAIWLLCLAAAFVLALVPRKLRWIGLGAGVAVFVLSLPFGGLALPLPGLGWVHLGWGEATVPGIGTMALHWRPVTAPVLESLFLRDNWNLLWYLLLPALWIGRGALRQPSLAALGWFFAFGAAFQFVLFFFTDASQWAQNLTSLNRIALQMVPALVFWVSLLWRARAAAMHTPHPSPRTLP